VQIRRIVAGLTLDDEQPVVDAGTDEDKPQLKEPSARPLKPILPPIHRRQSRAGVRTPGETGNRVRGEWVKACSPFCFWPDAVMIFPFIISQFSFFIEIHRDALNGQ